MTKIRAGKRLEKRFEKRSGKRSEKRQANRNDRRTPERAAVLPDAGTIEPAGLKQASERIGEKAAGKSLEEAPASHAGANGEPSPATAAEPTFLAASSQNAAAAEPQKEAVHSVNAAGAAPAQSDSSASAEKMPARADDLSCEAQKADESSPVIHPEESAADVPQRTLRNTPEAEAPTSAQIGADMQLRELDAPFAPEREAEESPKEAAAGEADEAADGTPENGEALRADLSGSVAEPPAEKADLSVKANAALETSPAASAAAAAADAASALEAPEVTEPAEATQTSEAAEVSATAGTAEATETREAALESNGKAAASADAAAPEAPAESAESEPLQREPEEALTITSSPNNKVFSVPIEETVQVLASAAPAVDASEPLTGEPAQDEALRPERSAGGERPIEPVLNRFLGRIALFGSVAFAAAALLFAAANWAGWPPALRIGFFALLALLPGVALLFPARLRTPLGEDAAGTAFGLMLCLFLAVTGQTYQSGEGAASLLSIWALLLTPWLFFVRRPMFFTLWFTAALLALLFQGDEILAGEARLARLLPGMLFACAASLPLSLAARLRGGVFRAAAVLPACAATLLSAGAAAFLLLVSAGNTPALSLVPVYIIAFGIAAAGFALSKRPELMSLIVFGLAALLEGIWFHAAGSITSNTIAYIPGILIAFAALIALWQVGSNGRVGRIGRSRPIGRKGAFRAFRIFGRRTAEAAADGSPAQNSAAPGDASAFAEPADPVRLSIVPRAASALLAALAVLLLLLLVLSIFELPTFETGAALAVLSLAAAAFFACRTPTARRASLMLAAALLAAAGIAMVFIEAADGSSLTATVLSSVLSLAASLIFRSSFALFAAMALPASAAAASSPWIPSAAAVAAGLLIALLRTPLSSLAGRRPRLADLAAKHLPAFIWMSWFGSGVLSWMSGKPLPDFAAGEGLLLCAGAALAALGGFAALLRAGFGRLFSFGYLALAAAVMVRFGPDAAPLILALAAMTPIPGDDPCRRSIGPWLFLILFWSSAHAAYWLLPSENGTNLLLHAALDQFFFAVLFGALLLLARLESKRETLPAAATPLERQERSSLSEPKGIRRFDRPARTVLLVLTAAVAAIGILRDELILDSGELFTAALAPVDPRDVLMGDFMALGYKALQNAPSAEALRKARRNEAAGLGANPEDQHIPYKACFGVNENAPGGLLQLLAVKPEGEAPPKGTRLELAYNPATRLAKLPSRWFFSSGEAPLWAEARYAALRCAEGRCLLAGLLDVEGRPIESAEKSFFDRLVNARY